MPILCTVPTDPGDESTTNIYVGNINPKVGLFVCVCVCVCVLGGGGRGVH